MKKNTLALIVLSLMAGMHAMAAQAAEEDVSRHDPARWYQADDTPDARYRNLHKEADAAYGEALQVCKKNKDVRSKARQHCRNEARAAKKEDLERARRIYDDYKKSSS